MNLSSSIFKLASKGDSVSRKGSVLQACVDSIENALIPRKEMPSQIAESLCQLKERKSGNATARFLLPRRTYRKAVKRPEP
jgi:hypothetical protein